VPADLPKSGLPLVANDSTRLFILGSLPGDVSLSARRYYAHPTNQFWRLLGDAIGEELQPLDYHARLELLAERSIGLWDVIASAVRPGSLDQAIRAAEHNHLQSLIRDFPALQAIAFNGGAASRLGRRLIGAPPGITLIDLPSSSAANTRSLAEKAAAWRKVGDFIPQ